MAFLITVALVVAGAVLLIAGLVASSTAALTGAAVVSLAAVLLLWRSVGKTRDTVFVTDAPAGGTPQWDEPLRDVDDEEASDPARDELPPVAIEQYQDLVASEIMPTLETLSVEELKAVIERERLGLGRPIIISRAETLIDLTRGGGVTTPGSLDIREEPAVGRSLGSNTDLEDGDDAQKRSLRRRANRDQGLSLE